MKVYVVYFIPDYYGIEIVKIFLKESDAIDFIASNPGYDYDYEEYEVESEV